ncbi:MAG: DUF1858 domain-containing protein [Actinomycetia bacterium]|nr:DUF1858 domain-containing protein [Actinomycetes bacterium]
MSVNKDMTIGSIVKSHPTTAEVFTRHGMACLDCPSTQFETLEQGAILHGLDVEVLVKELNEAAE